MSIVTTKKSLPPMSSWGKKIRKQQKVLAKPFSVDRLRVLKQLKTQKLKRLQVAHDLDSQVRANLIEAIIEALYENRR